jgi:hypothetical protein
VDERLPTWSICFCYFWYFLLSFPLFSPLLLPLLLFNRKKSDKTEPDDDYIIDSGCSDDLAGLSCKTIYLFKMLYERDPNAKWYLRYERMRREDGESRGGERGINFVFLLKKERWMTHTYIYPICSHTYHSTTTILL